MNIENEVEATRDGAFGLAAIQAERRREKMERYSNLAFKVTLSILALTAAAMIGYHSRIPKNEPFFIENPVGALTEKRSIDHKENCFVVSFVDERGRERHRNTHCPALAEKGMMGWPLEGK